MVYDCFQFFNEIDILRLRLHTLKNVVDRFVISEATVTFSGEPKPLYFEQHRELFSEFEGRIIHKVVEDTPDGSPFERDSFQKCAVIRGLSECSGDDLVIFSDVDEVPNPVKVRECLNAFRNDRIYHFAQRMFYYYLNLEEVSGKLLSFSGDFPGVREKRWLGTKMCAYSMLSGLSLEQLRFPERIEQGIRVADGGWHFSYMGGDKKMSVADRVAEKVRMAAHQEFNNARVHSRISQNIEKQKDIFGRRSKFKRLEIDGSFPEYLVAHQDEFSHLILKPTETRRFFGIFD